MEKVLLTEVMVEAFKLLVTERHERSYWKNSISISFLVDVDWRDSGCMNKTGDFVFKNSSTKNYVIYTVIEQINIFGNINFWRWVYAIIDSEDANCGYYKVQKLLKKEQHRWLSINQPFKKTDWRLHGSIQAQKPKNVGKYDFSMEDLSMIMALVIFPEKHESGSETNDKNFSNKKTSTKQTRRSW